MLSNEVPNLRDSGDVLPTRFIMLQFAQSFLGKENPKIKYEYLPAELPGIANRCLAAYRRLLKRGHFIQPKSGLVLVKRVQEKINPYVAFMNDCWVKDPESEGPFVGKFYERFMDWCRENERLDLVHGTTRNNLITHVRRIRNGFG